MRSPRIMDCRFPKIGEAAYRGIEMELRHALEPWHVLGEDPAGGGTVRAVNSSVERMQVKLNGATGERHVLLCNGRVVPLRATGHRGEYVAGVRYRAWQPARALHPTLPVDAPLVFDLYDRWNERSVGGFTYHVSHPGGRNFDRFRSTPMRRKRGVAPVSCPLGTKERRSRRFRSSRLASIR